MKSNVCRIEQGTRDLEAILKENGVLTIEQ